ncbi:MAG: TetR/AcrR family transcriptional regulator [Erysipelotrichaceae bacterium]
MNDKFYSLPMVKQQAIIKAGYKVFSQNSYKNSPMSEIADAAGISKSLLFYYFKNKKELYMFLWDQCAKTTIEYLNKYECYSRDNLFESMYRGMKAKMEIIHLYPDLANFVIKAYYETDAEISLEIQKSFRKYFNLKADMNLAALNKEQFVEGLDIEMMYRDMYWASEGFLWEMVKHGKVDVDKMEMGFNKLMTFWKSIYLRKK